MKKINQNISSELNAKTFTAIDSMSQISFKEATKKAEKKKWISRFLRSYSGSVKPNAQVYTSNSRYFVAYSGKLELGFIRLNNKKAFFPNYQGDVWSIADAYVKPKYRGNGVLKSLIQFSLKNHNAKMISLSTSVLDNNIGYYKKLGFSVVSRKLGLAWLLSTDFLTDLSNNSSDRVGSNIMKAA